MRSTRLASLLGLRAWGRFEHGPERSACTQRVVARHAPVVHNLLHPACLDVFQEGHHVTVIGDMHLHFEQMAFGLELGQAHFAQFLFRHLLWG